MSVTSLVSPYPYATGNVPQETQAFPVGFGASTTGGAGGTIIRVTSGANSGAGTLREALEQTGARIILFDVNDIVLTERIRVDVDEGNFTMYGQSAGGVQIRGAAGAFTDGQGLLVIRCGNYIIQGCKFRAGTAAGATLDNISIGSGPETPAISNVVIDHCDIIWGTDENMEIVGGCEDVTISNCILGQGIINTLGGTGEHSYGLLSATTGGTGLYANRVTMINNLFAYNRDRNPRFAHGEDIEFVNNYGYGGGCQNAKFMQFGVDPSQNTPQYCTAHVINNYYKKSSESESHTRVVDFANSDAVGGDYYVSGNTFLNANGTNATPVIGGTNSENASTTTEAFTGSGVTDDMLDAADVPEFVLANVGARHTDRDSLSAAIIALVEAQSPGIISDESEMGGYPTLPTFMPYTDSDNDGIPDQFEGSFSDLDEFMQYLIYNPLPAAGSVAGTTLTLAAGSRERTGYQATFALAGGAEATPVIESSTTGGGDNAGSWSITKPSGVVSGDLLLIVLAMDPESDSKTPAANPTGFDLEASGNTTSSAGLYIYSRIATGSEAASFGSSWTPALSTQWTAKCYRISGANGVTPINVVGTPVHTGNSTQKTAASATTTVDNCLGFAILAADGGDTSPFSTEATNSWTEEADLQSSTAASGMGLSISTKEQATAGAMGDCTINLAVSDGGYTVQFAIAPG